MLNVFRKPAAPDVVAVAAVPPSAGPDLRAAVQSISAQAATMGREAAEVRGQLDDAIPWLEKASRAPRYEAPHYPHFNLGRVYVAKEMYNRAIEEFTNALGLRPDYEVARKAAEALKRKLN